MFEKRMLRKATLRIPTTSIASSGMMESPVVACLVGCRFLQRRQGRAAAAVRLEMLHRR
jgi:hypothetical protein